MTLGLGEVAPMPVPALRCSARPFPCRRGTPGAATSRRAVAPVHSPPSGRRERCPGRSSLAPGRTRCRTPLRSVRGHEVAARSARRTDELHRSGLGRDHQSRGRAHPVPPDAAAKMAADILAAVAEYEHTLMVERTSVGMGQAWRRGTRSSNVTGRPGPPQRATVASPVRGSPFRPVTSPVVRRLS